MKKALSILVVTVLLVFISMTVHASSVDLSKYRFLGEFSIQSIQDIATVISNEGVCLSNFATISLISNPIVLGGVVAACIGTDYFSVMRLERLLSCNQVYEVWLSSPGFDIMLIPTRCMSW